MGLLAKKGSVLEEFVEVVTVSRSGDVLSGALLDPFEKKGSLLVVELRVLLERGDLEVNTRLP